MKEHTQEEEYLRSWGLRATRSDRAIGDCSRNALVKTGKTREGVAYKLSELMSPYCESVIIGGFMEHDALLLTALNKELTESKAILQNLANEVRAVQDIVGPALLAHAQQLRTARMTVVTEIQSSLTALREVRKFFLESNYAEEMERLERFVRVCQEIQALKQSGLFDAVVDSAIRLAVQEVSDK